MILAAGRAAAARGDDRPHGAVRDTPSGRPRHHRADRRVVDRRVGGERPDQPRRAGQDRPQPERAAARSGGPVAACPERWPWAVRRAISRAASPAPVAGRRACPTCPGSSAPQADGRSSPGYRPSRHARPDDDRRPPPPHASSGEAPRRPGRPQLAPQARGGRPRHDAVRGFVVSQSVQEFTGRRPDQPLNMPDDRPPGDNLPDVTRASATSPSATPAPAPRRTASRRRSTLPTSTRRPVRRPFRSASSRSTRVSRRRAAEPRDDQRHARSRQDSRRDSRATVVPGPDPGGPRCPAGGRDPRDRRRSPGPPRSSTGSPRCRRTSSSSRAAWTSIATSSSSPSTPSATG